MKLLPRFSRSIGSAAWQVHLPGALLLGLLPLPALAQINQDDRLVSAGIQGDPSHPHVVLAPPASGSRQLLGASSQRIVTAFSVFGPADPEDPWSVSVRSFDAGLQPTQPDFDLFGGLAGSQRVAQRFIDRPNESDPPQILALELSQEGGPSEDIGLYDAARDELLPLTYAGSQARPSLAWDDDDRLFVVYETTGAAGGSGTDSDIALTPIASAGPLVPFDEVRLNSFTAGDQLAPQILRTTRTFVGTAQGPFLAVWQSNGSPGSDQSSSSIQARFLGGNGAPIGNQFQVNFYTDGAQSDPRATALDDDTLLIVWRSEGSFGNDNSFGSIQARRFQLDGTPIGPEFQVNNRILGDQRQPAVAPLPDGAFIVVWTDEGVTDINIAARRFAPGGAPLEDQFVVNQNVADENKNDQPSVVTEGDEFYVVWRRIDEIYLNGSFGGVFADGFESGDTSAWTASTP